MACANADTPASKLPPAAAEKAVLCLINEQRAENGVPPLSLNLKLRAAARLHAKDAATIKWWAGGGPKIHINPVTGSTPEDRITDAGYCPDEKTPPVPVPVNENGYYAIYTGGSQSSQGGTTPRAAVKYWMDSPGHRNTLLNPVYIESGVAVVLGIAETGPATGGAIFVQTFGGCPHPVISVVGQGWGWGVNIKGGLGDGTTTNRLTPVRPQNLNEVTAVAGGGYHSLAINGDGSVSAWGSNTSGQLGDGTTLDRHTPVQVTNLTGVTAVAGGAYFSLALKDDGSVWAWGSNTSGELGDGTTLDRHTPVQVANLSGVTAIAAGFGFGLALKDDGTVWSWGHNEYGELGDGTTIDRLKPVQVAELGDVVAIAAGFGHCLVLNGDGSVWAWGANSSGQLGDSSLTSRLTPVKVHMSPSLIIGAIVAIAAGGVHSMALEQTGGVWTWGGNAYGQLGIGDNTDRWAPMRPHYLHGVVAIAAGFGHSLALKDDGTVWAWGVNNWGQLGDGTTIDRTTRVQTVNLSGVTDIVGGLHHSLAP
jgi:alpha-tubulin suppressor-like RCC1 family protein/uncharacterized protein YkwD